MYLDISGVVHMGRPSGLVSLERRPLPRRKTQTEETIFILEKASDGNDDVVEVVVVGGRWWWLSAPIGGQHKEAGRAGGGGWAAAPGASHRLSRTSSRASPDSRELAGEAAHSSVIAPAGL